MASQRRPRAKRPTGAAPRPRSLDLGEWPGPRPQPTGRGGLLPTVLWSAGAIVAAVPLVAIIMMAGSQHLTEARWSLIGVIFLSTVIVFVLALKALQSFLNWRRPD